MAASANEIELEIISAAVDHNFKLQAEKCSERKQKVAYQAGAGRLTHAWLLS